jgi:transposase-like protein
MATREQFKLSTSERRRRTFSENFKKQKVQEIERGISKVAEICKQYEVSNVSVYRWISKFGTMEEKKERLIVKTESDTRQLLELKKKVAELEQIIGQKQILIDFKDKMIELAEEQYHIDIKKNYSGTQSNITGSTEK